MNNDYLKSFINITFFKKIRVIFLGCVVVVFKFYILKNNPFNK